MDPSIVRNEQECRILELLSVFYAPVERHRFLDALGVVASSARQPSLFGEEVQAALSALEERGLVVRRKDRVVCRADLREPLTREAHREGRFRDLARTVDRVLRPSSWARTQMQTSEQGLREVRLALFAGDHAGARRHAAECLRQFPGAFHDGSPYQHILESPYDEAWMFSLPPDLVGELIAQVLSEAFSQLTDGEPYFGFLERYVAAGKATPYLKYFLAAQLFWRGLPEEAEQLYPSGEEGTYSAAARGWLSFLRGDDAAAIGHFWEALASLRKDTRRRAVYLGTVGECFYALALLRSGSREDLNRLVDHFRPLAGKGWEGLSQVYGGFCRLALLRLGRVQEAGHWPGPSREPERIEDLYGLLRGCLAYWEHGDRAVLSGPGLERFCSWAVDGGYLWLALEGLELLSRIDPARVRYAEQVEGLRREMGVEPLCDVLAPEEPWRPVLRALAGLATEAADAATAQGNARLAWFLLGLGQEIQVEPRVQRRAKRGGWTKGRSVALHRLAQENDSTEGVTDRDREVLRAVSESYGYHSYAYFGRPRFVAGSARILAALVGHPLVFRGDDPSVRVEVARAEPELRAERKGGKIRLSLHPPLDGQPGPLIHEESPSRVLVVEVGETQRRLAEILGQGVTVPAAEEEQVRHAVSSVASLVTVHSDVGGADETAEELPADPRIRVQLRPEGDGYRVRLAVRPLGDDGPAYRPGEGGRTVVAEVNGVRVQTHRDLAGERRAADGVAGCGAASSNGRGAREWMLEGAEPCLDLLGSVRELEEQVVVEWPEGRSLTVAARSDLAQLRLRASSKGEWFDVDGELEVDEGRVLALAELLERVRSAGSRFIPLGDDRFLALTRSLQRRLGELEAFGEKKGDSLRFHPLAMAALEDLTREAGSFQGDRGWARRLEERKEAELLDPPVPSTLQAELREYQREGYRWLSRLAHLGAGACLADDMGLGKTVQALAVIVARAPDGPTLVVAPTSVCMNWLDEARRFAPTLRPIPFADGDRAGVVETAGPFDLVIASYGLLHREGELLARVEWQTVVLDEAQAIKNVATKRSHAAMKLQAGFRIITTGTPVENHLGELWNLFRFLNPGLLGSLKRFNERFAGPIERNADRAALDRLKRLIGPFLLRRTKSQVLAELPPRSEVLVHVDLSAEERALYEAMRRDAVERASRSEGPAGQRRMTILAEIMKLRRACCHPSLVAGDAAIDGAKLETFAALVDELRDNRHKALVFSQFVDHLRVIREHLDAQGVPYQYLDGSTPAGQRRKRVAAFQAGEGDLFLISLKAGGTGLNLTAADYVIHLDPWWNPAVEDQASDRAHRIGQTRPVTVYRLVARNTIEDKIVELHHRKRELAEGILEGAESARLSLDELMDLLREG